MANDFAGKSSPEEKLVNNMFFVKKDEGFYEIGIMKSPAIAK